MLSDKPFEMPLIPPSVVTLVPYEVARRLSAVAVSATAQEITVLVPNTSDERVLSELQTVTSRWVTPVQAPQEEIELLLDHMSGSLNEDDLWLQARHIAALSRLVDHAVNVGQVEAVRSLVDRALEFAPYSAELWLLKARTAGQRNEVVDALRAASQIAPNDRRILRWIQSIQESEAPELDTANTARSSDNVADPIPFVPLREVEPSSAPHTSTAVTEEPLQLRPERASPSHARGSAEQIADSAFGWARALSTIHNLDELMRKTAEALHSITGADSVSIYVPVQTKWSGWSTSLALQARIAEALPKANRLAVQVLKQGLPIVITDTSARLQDAGNLAHDVGIRSFALLPLRLNGAAAGLVYINYLLPDIANEVYEPERGRGIELILNCAGNVAGALHDQVESSGSSAGLDELTDSYTYAQFERLLAAEIERARRYRFSVSVMSIDIDGFSEVNRQFGSTFGDGVLREVVVKAQALERASDVLAHRADDEFMVMLPQTTSSGAEIVARRLHRALIEGVVVDGRKLPVRVSVGIATFPDQVDDGAQLLSAADIALYAAKAKGKDRGKAVPDHSEVKS